MRFVPSKNGVNAAAGRQVARHPLAPDQGPAAQQSKKLGRKELQHGAHQEQPCVRHDLAIRADVDGRAAHHHVDAPRLQHSLQVVQRFDSARQLAGHKGLEAVEQQVHQGSGLWLWRRLWHGRADGQVGFTLAAQATRAGCEPQARHGYGVVAFTRHRQGQTFVKPLDELHRLRPGQLRQFEGQVNDLFQVLKPGDGHLGFGACEAIVFVAVRNATLDDFVVQRHHEGKTFDVEQGLDDFQSFNGFFGQAAVEVVNEDDEVKSYLMR